MFSDDFGAKMKLTLSLQNKIISAYVGTIFVLLMGLGFSLYQNWYAQINEMAAELVDESTVSSALVESSLLDASRILDVAKHRMLSATANHSISDEKAHEILKSAIDEFSVFQPENLLGLLFYADKNGIIRATNGEYPTKNIDVTDRLYFSKLVANPELKISIGNKVIGRRTNKEVFHVAVPLVDPNNHFDGILMQQISVDSISNVLEGSSAHKKFQTITFQRNGFVSYSHSNGVLVENERLNNSIQNAVQMKDQKAGWFLLPSGLTSAEPSLYIGYTKAPLFGLTTVTIIPSGVVFNEFLSVNIKLILFAVTAFCLLSALFFSLYRQVKINGINRELSIRDPLTGIFNRRGLDEVFPNLWHDAIRHRKAVSVLFVDIDHFKIFNDTCGHELGDLALKAVATAISSSCKRPLDFCCRWGGEEFVLVLPETDELGAVHIAESLLNLVKDIKLPEQCPLKLGVSVGIATSDGVAKKIDDDLIDMADKAMLEAKRSGRGRYVVHKEHH